MSRKIILSLVAIGALAAATLVSGAADAKGNHNGNHNGPHYKQSYPHWRYHVRHFHDRVYVRPVYAVRTVQPGPCTCLTKNYTPKGLVVFKDQCTQEMASARVDGSPDNAQAEPGPANFAGQTYQDYLKANPQATQKN